MEKAAQALLASYQERGLYNTTGGGLPTRKQIVDLLLHVEEVLFPGFSGAPLARPPDATWLAARVAMLRADLAAVVVLECADCDERPEDEALAMAQSFVDILPRIRSLLLDDVAALYDGDPASQSMEEVILAYPGLRATMVHRIAHHFWNDGARLLARMMSEYIHSQTGIDIHPGAQIGRRFHIDHGTGVVIGETTRIGDDVKIYQGVSLGALSVSKKKHGQKRHPTIEDHVTIYAGATILGGDTVIGHHAIIGGNVWVVRSVGSYAIVENDPRVRIRSKEDKNAWFYSI